MENDLKSFSHVKVATEWKNALQVLVKERSSLKLTSLFFESFSC